MPIKKPNKTPAPAQAVLNIEKAFTAKDIGTAIILNNVPFIITKYSAYADYQTPLQIVPTIFTSKYTQLHKIKDDVEFFSAYNGTDTYMLKVKGQLAAIEFDFSQIESGTLRLSDVVAGSGGNLRVLGIASGERTEGFLSVNGQPVSTTTTMASSKLGFIGSNGACPTMQLPHEYAHTLVLNKAVPIPGIDKYQFVVTNTIGTATFSFIEGGRAQDCRGMMQLPVDQYTTLPAQLAATYRMLTEMQKYAGTDAYCVHVKNTLLPYTLTAHFSGSQGFLKFSSEQELATNFAFDGAAFPLDMLNVDGVALPQSGDSLLGYKQSSTAGVTGTLVLTKPLSLEYYSSSVSFNGQPVNFLTTNTILLPTAVDIKKNTAVDTQMRAICKAVKDTQNYQGTSAQVLAAKQAWSTLEVDCSVHGMMQIQSLASANGEGNIRITTSFGLDQFSLNGELFGESANSPLATFYRGNLPLTYADEEACYA